MVHIGMPIGARDHACDQGILEKRLPKREAFYKMQLLDSKRENNIIASKPGIHNVMPLIYLCSPN